MAFRSSACPIWTARVIARVREWSRVPIIVLSVRAPEAEKVSCSRACGQRCGRRQDGEPPAVLEGGDLTIDIARRRVRWRTWSTRRPAKPRASRGKASASAASG
jgi:hypothetical protein